MSATVVCGIGDCTELVEDGASYSENRSSACDRWARHCHSHCRGSFTLVEMDVLTLKCECYCHVGKGS